MAQDQQSEGNMWNGTCHLCMLNERDWGGDRDTSLLLMALFYCSASPPSRLCGFFRALGQTASIKEAMPCPQPRVLLH